MLAEKVPCTGSDRCSVDWRLVVQSLLAFALRVRVRAGSSTPMSLATDADLDQITFTVAVGVRGPIDPGDYQVLGRTVAV